MISDQYENVSKMIKFGGILLILAMANNAISQNTRIIGGRVTYVGEFGAVVAIDVHTKQSTFFCGGALLSNQWIITAGICVDGATNFEIHLGSTKRESDGDDPNSLLVATSTYVLHPDYNAETLQSNLGLIKLHMPIQLNSFIKKIDFLPTFRIQDGAFGTAVGWGQTTDDNPEYSPILRAVDLTVISNNECANTYGNYVTDDIVCMAGSYNEGICTGDTGTPLLQHIGRGMYLLAGVASFLSASGCESIDPSGFIRVYSYVDWIKDVTELQ